MMQNFKLVQLDCKMTAAEWIALQSRKPKNVINGSFWDMPNPDKGPIGTVIVDGAVIKDGGNSYGFGVDKDGVPRFGRAYPDKDNPEKINWKYLLTAYPEAYIVKGKACALPSGNSIVTTSATRSVVYLQDGIVRLNCFPAQTMPELQAKLLNAGVTEAIALDGGGSCFLYTNGVQTEYQSKDNKSTVQPCLLLLVVLNQQCLVFVLLVLERGEDFYH